MKTNIPNPQPKSNETKRLFFGLDVDSKWTPRILVLLILFLWGACWVFVTMYKSLPVEQGQFGDMFGAVNALFSGLAFAGIIYTILLQREELGAQRKELKQTRKEFKIQNATLKQQRFENTF